MVLIMVDELGDEVEYARYKLSPELQEDEDALEIWKDRKEARAGISRSERLLLGRPPQLGHADRRHAPLDVNIQA